MGKIIIAFLVTGLITVSQLAAADEGNRVIPDVPGDWNWHAQATNITQAHPGFSADYSGPNSLNAHRDLRETTSFDLYAGTRLWSGAEAHIDGLVWQGFGLSNAVGADAFPNGEAFRLGTNRPNAIVARAFVRQTIDLGGETAAVENDALNLPGRHAKTRLTVTAGKFSAKDIFDNNRYANDPRTQFMSWALMANEAWDYPADSLGFESGVAVELTHPAWAIRAGLFQMPRYSNAMPVDPHLLKAWGSVVELEHRLAWSARPGLVRLLFFLNRARMGSYEAAVAAAARPADLIATRAYRSKSGAGLNLEQEIAPNVGVFARIGWSDGRNEGWCFSDVDRSASAGISISGEAWHRADDHWALAGVVNALSASHRRYFAAGGTGILAGDGALDYAAERAVETYYDGRIAASLHAALDYQLLLAPAFNRARGPVSVFAVRLHWEL